MTDDEQEEAKRQARAEADEAWANAEPVVDGDNAKVINLSHPDNARLQEAIKSRRPRQR